MHSLDKKEAGDITHILTVLVKLSEQGKLEPFEIDILKSLAERDREISPNKETARVIPIGEPHKGNGEKNREQQGNNNEDITTEQILEVLGDNKVQFGILGTDGKKAGHHTQFTNFGKDKYWKLGLFDSPENIPENLRDDPRYLWVRFREDKDLGNKYALLLRVADDRVDHRSGSHTTVFLLIPKEIQRSQFESLAKDVDGLKRIMKLIFEKAKSPLNGAEGKIRQSFLV